LHAAHESRDGQGRFLAVVHRDVSPQNVMIGAEGLARVLDFGIAQAAFRSQTTREGRLRAKLAYAAPEHVLDQAVDRRADVYSAAVVAWELLTLERLFTAGNEGALLARVLEQTPRLASELRPGVSPAVDALLASALSKNPAERPSTAEDFAVAFERVAAPATHREVARWLASLGHEALARLAKRKAELEAGGALSDLPTATPTSTSFARSIDTRTSDVAVPSVDTSASAALLHTRLVRPAWSRARVTAAVCVVFGMLIVAPALLGRKLSLGSRASAALSPIGMVDSAGPGPASAGVGPGQAKGLGGDGVSLPALAESASTGTVPTAGSHAAATEPGPVSVPSKRILPSSAPRPAAKARTITYNEDCSQLTEVDSQGIRRVKRQCLREPVGSSVAP
jgi:eukaryotic-like serine/threonine-protein kinase